MIIVKGLTKYYGNKLGVQDISFTINKGETVGLLGPNGAGKSTIMKMLAGYMYPTAGTIMINKIDALTNTTEAVRHIGFMPENPPLYLDMDVRGYLDFIAVIKGVDSKVRATQIDEIMELTSIKNVGDRLIKNLSKGYRQRVGLAMALINFPEVLILDEPTIGLDPKQINEVRNLIENLSKKHTIIISSHILSEIAMMCKKIIIISNGKIVLNDSIENIEEGGKNLIIRVKGQAEKVIKILSGIQEISKTKKIVGNMETDREYCRFLITGDGSMALREKIFQRMAESKLPLVELSSIGNSLEDRFINITS
jgi:ABC-2 type transport system ATP-binding protein